MTRGLLAVMVLGALVIGCATPVPAESPPPSPSPEGETSPATGPAIRYEGVVTRQELTAEETDLLETIEAAYLRAAEGMGWAMADVTLVETRGGLVGDIGVYLIHGEGAGGTLWQLSWTISPQTGVLRPIPPDDGKEPIWDADYRRFVYLDEGGDPITAFVANLEESVPLIERIAWRGFSVAARTYIRQAMEWLREASPDRFDFVQAQRIAYVDHVDRDIARTAARASGDRITIDRLGLYLPRNLRQVQQAWFLSLLYHEAIHVRQYRLDQECNLETEAYAGQAALLTELQVGLPDAHGDAIQRLIDDREEYLAGHDDSC
ncbi:MAG: hypothetical protein ACE5NC_02005 [Anaerolineae bacterium]